MERAIFTQQLNTEIEKIKERDYTSYQNFYSQTVNYLYGIIWENVQDRETANTIVAELYDEIYSSIGTELTDNNRFYEWAEGKARDLSTTYMTTHMAGNNKSSDDLGKMAVVAMASGLDMNQASGANIAQGEVVGAGVNAATGGTVNAGMNAGMSTATGGTMNAGMNTATGGTMNAGMNTATGGTMNAGMNTATGGTVNAGMNAGMSTATGGISHDGTDRQENGKITKKSGRKPVKPGMSTGAKIAVIVASIAVVIGGGIGVFKITKSKEKTEDVTTVAGMTTESVAEPGTEPATEESIPIEEVDETSSRYSAYYKKVQGIDTIIYYQTGANNSCISGLGLVKLVDFEGNGNEQLLTVESYYSGDVTYTSTISGTHTIKVYDFDGSSAQLIDEINWNQNDYEYNKFMVGIQKSGDKNCIWIGSIKDGTQNSQEEFYTYYELKDGKFERAENTNTAPEDIDWYYHFDGCCDYHADAEAYVDYCPVNKSLIKTLITKHRTIIQLAEASNDEAMINGNSELGFELTSREGSTNYIIETPVNKFYEAYVINDGFSLSNTMTQNSEGYISSDNTSLHLQRDDSLEEAVFAGDPQVYADVYFEYIDDVLVPVGEKYSVVNAECSTAPYCSWMTVEDYMVSNPSQAIVFSHTVSDEEFNSQGNGLMAK